ncbi:hypothetical protein [Spirillospora sp. NPDC048823]|uniref:hypothetical protein n=1 Tax=unclassified Spirillospora TaxID=2642701 RepID=UPI00371610C9
MDAFASGMWRKILKDPARPVMLVRRHLEVCVFSYLGAPAPVENSYKPAMVIPGDLNAEVDGGHVV